MAIKKNTTQKFETSLKDLEEIVRELENSQIDLDEHLKLYEKGIRLIQSCQLGLKEAEQKIQLLREAELTPRGNHNYKNSIMNPPREKNNKDCFL